MSVTSAPLTLALVRHGETPLTPSGIYSGSGVPGPSLSDHGRRQVKETAARLLDFESVVPGLWPVPSVLIASPMVRAQETAEIFAEVLDLTPITDGRARECNFGDWEGLKPAEIDARWPGRREVWHNDGTIAAPGGGESTADVGMRTMDLLKDLYSEYAGHIVVLAAHAVTIRSILGTALLAPAGAWLRLPPASISTMRIDGARSTLVLGLGLPGGV